MDRKNELLVAAFAEVLLEQRTRVGLSQEQLAERADLSARHVSHLETARRQPSLTALLAISRGLGIPMSVFVEEVERRLKGQGDR